MKPELLTEQRAEGAERKLNIGCGDRPFDGWTNVDVHPYDGCTLADARELPFPSAAFEYVYAGEVLEHLPIADTNLALQEWKRVLVSGGTLEITVPDIDVICRLFLENADGKKWDYWLLAIYGRQLWSGDYHTTGFTVERLREFLEGVGPWLSVEVFNDGEFGRRVHAFCTKKL